MSVTLRDSNGLHVTAALTAGGGLKVSGQHLRDGSQYEYVITVEKTDVPVVVAALGGAADSSGDAILELLQAHGEMIVHAGEATWLRSLGISPGFWSH